jgi:HlyD family secretion protein
MRLSFPIHRSLRALAAVAVWSGSIAGALWLYRELGGPSEAIAIAEAKEYRVGPALLGRLTSLEVSQGQCVAGGQVVARLDTEPIRGEISVAEAEVRHAASEVRAADVSFEASQQQVARSFGSEVEAAWVDFQAARAQQAHDRTALDKLAAEIHRENDLVRRGLANSNRLSALELTRAGLEETVRSWPARLASIEQRRSAAEARLEDWRRAHPAGPEGSRSVQLRPVQDRVRGRQQSLQVLRAQLHQTVLRAASAACVSLIHARPGDVVRPGDPVVTLVEARPRQVIAYVEERRGAALQRGSKVVARRRNATRDRVEGAVVAVAGDVSALPQRVWANPHTPSWGRAIYISVPENASLDPGEMLDILKAGESSPAPRLFAFWRSDPS